MYEEDDEDIALMAIEESDAEPESDSKETEVNLLNLKDKLVKFSKKKLPFLLLASIDTIQELVNTKSQLLASLSSLKFEHIDLNKNKHDLQGKIKQLESHNLELRTENLKLKVLGKEKGRELPDQTLEVDKLKNVLKLEKENSRRINLELTRMRSDLERANKWTKSSMIVTHLGNNNRNIKTGIGYEQSINGNPMFCIICGISGHSKQYCPKYKASAENNARGTYKTVQRNRYTQRKNNLPKWAYRDLIHPFCQYKGPKLVWFPKSNI